MKKEIEVPEVGESVSSGILAVWLKEDGAPVEEGEEIFELETDKATLGIPSPATGTLHRAAAEGDEVAVGQSVGQIDTEGTAEDTTKPADDTAKPAQDTAKPAQDTAKPGEDGAKPTAAPSGAGSSAADGA